MFNKYKYLEEFKAEIREAIVDGDIEDMNSIHDLIYEETERASNNYNDAFAIAYELNAYDFTDFDLGTATNITQLAMFALTEYLIEEFDFTEAEELINKIHERITSIN